MRILILFSCCSVILLATACGGGSGPTTYTISATTSGLPNGESVVIHNNGGDALTIATNSTLTPFATTMASGATYAITVLTNPNAYKCTVGNGIGTAVNNVTNVTVNCSPITYTVSTLAGTVGVSGANDGTGQAASFYGAIHIALDAAGNVYASDATDPVDGWPNPANSIRKISPSGAVTTLAGGLTQGSSDGPVAGASFNGPRGVAVDSHGNTFVADYGNARIRKITPEGVVSTFAGSSPGLLDGTGVAAQFLQPQGLTIDASDNLYLTDEFTIRKITPGAVVTTLAGSDYGDVDGRGANAKFTYPHGLTVDVHGNVYVCDVYGPKIRKITPDGEVSTFAGSTVGFADGVGTAASFHQPYGIAIDSHGNLYVADGRNKNIRLITPAGVVTTIAGIGTEGSTDGVGSDASFSSPVSIAVDVNGNVYVSDYSNKTIRKLTPN